MLLFGSDSDWAGCPTTRRSTKGYVIKFMGGPLVAVSRRQRNVTKSSCEAEYCTLSDCAADIIWIKNLAEIFKCTFPSPAILRCDNQTAINMANSEVALKRTKHIEAFKKFIGVKYHWIRELVRYSCKKQAAVVLYCILGPSEMGGGWTTFVEDVMMKKSKVKNSKRLLGSDGRFD